jgi:hypothetical protein
VAILTVVVGLLIVTCAFLLLFSLHRGQRTIAILKSEYLDQVAIMTAREVTRLRRFVAQVLRVQERKIQSGVHSTPDATLARALARALEIVSVSEENGAGRLP